MPEHPGGLVHREPPQRLGALRALRADQPLVVEQAGVLQRLEVAQAVGREGPVDLAVGVEDAALGVAKAPRLEAGGTLVSAGGRTGGAE